MPQFDYLQPHDNVIVVGHRGQRWLRTVARVTKTQIVLDNGAKFSLRGREWGQGDSPFVMELEAYTDARWQEYLGISAANRRAAWMKRVRSACAEFIQAELTDDEAEAVYIFLRNKGMPEEKQ